MSISCDRPDRRNPYHFTNFSARTLTFKGTGAVINSAFPLVTRLATLKFQLDAAIFNIVLSTSIINATANDTCGLFAALDRGPAFSMTDAPDLLIGHITEQNSIAGLPGASSRCNTLGFGADSAYRLPSGVPIAIYGCSTNTANNLFSALLIVDWAPASGLG